MLTINRNEKLTDTVFGFDLDHTLIKPKGKRKFPKDHSDWEWLYPCIPDKLKEINEHSSIMIFTNQSKQKDQIEKKIDDISKVLGFPIEVNMSYQNDEYRKPDIQMYLDRGVCAKEFIFIGDAAGRKNDFSASDRAFVENLKMHGINAKFMTPEEFFLNNVSEPWKFPFEPIDYIDQCNKIDINQFQIETQTMFILVGEPASTKSTLAKMIQEINENVCIINRDTLKTKAKCIKETKLALKNGKSVVIDNTNPDKKTRNEYVSLIDKDCVSLICVNVIGSKELINHLNVYRSRISDVARIPKIAYSMYYKKYQEPTLDEGFTKIINYNITLNIQKENELKFKMYS